MESELKRRSEVAQEDTWDLTRIYKSDQKWRDDFGDWKKFAERITDYDGKLTDVDTIIEFFKYEEDLDREGDKLGTYVFLKSTEDLSNATYQEMQSEFSLAASQIGESASFVRPQLLANAEVWQNELTGRLQPWRVKLERILRLKPHTLSESEERLIASVSDVADTPSKAFRLLSDVETKFESVNDEDGVARPLTNETLQLFLHSGNRTIRKEAFDKFYAQYEARQNTFAALLEGSIRKDVFYAKTRGFETSLQAAMFQEEVSQSVYVNLIEVIRESLPSLYRYYELRRKLMKLDQIHFYDVYVPILSDITVNYQWDEAVELIGAALQPLGSEYVETITKGLTTERWVDRYENESKESGAFSCPGYDFPPYILTNYKSSTIESVFTLAHEGGHSMHSWYSARNQPYRYYDYVIFLAEIASTFNEQLLARYLLANQTDPKMRAWIINRELDAIRATIFRQTMFSEFEFRAHKVAEESQPLSANVFRKIYRDVLNEYFGSDFVIDDALELECLRIPHFYRGYYVYKYATGLSAAIALADRVLGGGEREREDYLGFLKAGCSAAPLDILRAAGVDMEKPEPIRGAMARFDALVNELEETLS
ncbi:MAG: oligoendopeptidase F [Planctomycetia bacterium]|nr:oligoendopeptidase F [Planctomycetia bacterium]